MDLHRTSKAALVSVLAAAALGCGDASARVGPKPAAGGQVVVLLHGYGARGDDLLDLAKELSRARPEVTFLLPEGPHGVGGDGRSWVPDFTAPSREQYTVRLEAEVKTTIAGIWKVIDGARRKGVACKDIMVGGFSQGGRIAVQLALTAPADCPLGGVIVLSGGGARDLALPPASAVPRLRVLVAHGRGDAVVPFDAGRETAGHFADGGHDVRVLWFQGPHRIVPEVREAIPRFLQGEPVGEAMR